jgi:hypothetical protein
VESVSTPNLVRNASPEDATAKVAPSHGLKNNFSMKDFTMYKMTLQCIK